MIPRLALFIMAAACVAYAGAAAGFWMGLVAKELGRAR